MATRVVFSFCLLCFTVAQGLVDYERARQWAAYHNITCILVFGDSTVDPGNNNRLSTAMKSNFLPYGMDFFNAHPSGRFCNGRLATDFIAEALGYTSQIKAFLDPALEKKDLLHGVSFASAASGYDELTANLSNVLTFSKQIDFFKHYKLRLKKTVGPEESEKIVSNALFIMSTGTNDFLQNYYADSTRSKQYSVEQYMDYLMVSMKTSLTALHSLGARRMVLVGLPPFGCLPLVRTLRGKSQCDGDLNSVASSFNNKLQLELKSLKLRSLRSVYVDIYNSIQTVFDKPENYGFTVSMKGCCGTGMFEYGRTCQRSEICSDRTKYIFFDAVHLTDKMNKIVAEKAIQLIYSYKF